MQWVSPSRWKQHYVPAKVLKQMPCPQLILILNSGPLTLAQYAPIQSNSQFPLATASYCIIVSPSNHQVQNKNHRASARNHRDALAEDRVELPTQLVFAGHHHSDHSTALSWALGSTAAVKARQKPLKMFQSKLTPRHHGFW